MQRFQCNAMQYEKDCALIAMFGVVPTGASNKLGVVDGLASVTQSAWGLANVHDVPMLKVTVQ